MNVKAYNSNSDPACRFLKVGAQAIFIVDDQKFDRVILKKHLKRIFAEEIDIHLLKSGDELITKLKIENDNAPLLLGGEEKKMWLVFLDLDMPETNGIETLKKLQNYEYIDNVLLMIISGSTDCVEIDSAYKNGAYAFLPKPFSKFSFDAALYRQAKKDKIK